MREKKENEEREAMMRQERIALKKQDKGKDILRINKIQEYQKEVDFQAILEKNRKAEDFK